MFSLFKSVNVQEETINRLSSSQKEFLQKTCRNTIQFLKDVNPFDIETLGKAMREAIQDKEFIKTFLAIQGVQLAEYDVELSKIALVLLLEVITAEIARDLCGENKLGKTASNLANKLSAFWHTLADVENIKDMDATDPLCHRYF